MLPHPGMRQRMRELRGGRPGLFLDDPDRDFPWFLGANDLAAKPASFALPPPIAIWLAATAPAIGHHVPFNP